MMVGKKGQLTFIKIKGSRSDEVLPEIHLDTFDQVIHPVNPDLFREIKRLEFCNGHELYSFYKSGIVLEFEGVFMPLAHHGIIINRTFLLHPEVVICRGMIGAHEIL